MLMKSKRNLLIGLALAFLSGMAFVVWNGRFLNHGSSDGVNRSGVKRAVVPTSQPLLDSTRGLGTRTETLLDLQPSLLEYRGPGGFEVFVQDFKTHQPVSNVAVYVYCPPGGGAKDLYDSLHTSPNIPPVIAKEGSEYRSNSAGIVQVPPTFPNTLVVANSGNRYCFMLLAKGIQASNDAVRGANRLVLPLVSTKTLSVMVVDSAGIGLRDVRVLFSVEQENSGPIALRCTTDRDGRTAFYFANVLFRQDSSVSSASIQVENYGPIAEVIALDRDKIPPDPVVLLVSDAVSVVVSLVDDDGDKLKAVDFDIRLECFDHKYFKRRTSTGGVANFLGVPQNSLCEVSLAYSAPDYFVAKPVAFKTVATKANSLQVSLQVAFDGTAISGRLVDTDGNGIANTDFQPRIEARDAQGEQIRLMALFAGRTDSEGNFVCFVPNLDEIKLDDKVIASTALWLHGDDLASDWRVAATRDLSNLIGLHRFSVGDLVFAKSSQLFSGSIFDEFGGPIAGAIVQARPVFVLGGASSLPLSDCLLNLLSYTPLRSVSGSDGKFEICFPDSCPPAPFRIFVGKPGYGQVVSPIVYDGLFDLKLQLPRAGGIRGYVVGGRPQTKGWSASLELQKSSYPKSPLLPSYQVIGNPLNFETLGRENMQALLSGEFGWLGVPPGTYRVVYRNESRGLQPVYVEGLVVTAGVILEDPRLRALQLDTLVPTITVKVFSSTGSLVVGETRVSTLVGGDVLSSVSARGGILSVALPTLPVDLLIESESHRTEVLSGVSADIEVSLKDPYVVELVLTGEGVLDKRHLKLGARLVHLDAQGRESIGYSAEFDENASCSVPVGSLGKYRLQLLGALPGQSELIRWALIGRPSEISLTEAAAIFTIPLSVSDLDSL